MKKLLMMGAILVLGATVMGANPVSETNTAPVYLQAEITADNLIISGIDGRDILLDFGRISKNTMENTGRGAEAEFKVEYVGTKKSTDNQLSIILQDNQVPMSHTTVSAAEKMTATLAMSDRLGTAFAEQAGKIAGIADINDIDKKGEVYRGKITGTLPATDIRKATEGMYEGATQLTVTLTGTGAGPIVE